MSIMYNNLPYELVDSINNVRFVNGRFVAVGTSGVILTSYNGTDWDKCDSNTDRQLCDVAYGNGVYVIVGDNTILTSSDAVAWIEGDTVFTNVYIYSCRNTRAKHEPEIKAIVYADGKFVAVGRFGISLNSVDGIVWNGNVESYNDSPNEIIHDGDKFITIGYYSPITTSVDGVRWSINRKGSFSASIAHHCGKYVTVGCSSIEVSTNMCKWTNINTTLHLTRVIRANELFIAVANGDAILTSSDGINWTETNIGTNCDMRGIAYGNDVYVIAGTNGAIAISKDTHDWTKVSGSLYI